MIVRLAALLVATLVAQGAFAERRVALVIGNAQYQKINKLENPVNDAPDIAEALRKVGFDVIVRTDADKGGFDRALSEFARKAVGSDAALFYYAGHGIQYQKQNYLLPVDIEVEDYNDVEFQSVNVNRVMDALSRTNGVKIVVLDACRDNPLEKRISGSTRAAGGLSRGLARLDRTEGIVVAYATAPDQVAQDGSGRNSPFTEALIKRLAEPGLEIATLFRRVTQDVYERTNGRQRPEVSISLLNDYYLNLSDSDSLAWGRIRDSSEAAEFRTFIQRYPQSPFAREAQFRLDLFDRIRRENETRLAREQEQAAAERDKQRRETLEGERQRLEAQRKELETLEAQRLDIEKREAARREVERIAAQRRQEAARAEAARLTAERAEAAQREAQRQDAEKVAQEKRQEGERREVARLAAEQREAARVSAEQETRRIAEQREADRREVAKLAVARRLEADRREVERLAALRRAEADRSDTPQQLASRTARPASEPQISARVETAPAIDSIAAEKRREEIIVAAEAAELKRLLAERLKAVGAEAARLDAAIRELDRRAVERLAAQKRRETERLAGEARPAPSGGPLGLAAPGR